MRRAREPLAWWIVGLLGGTAEAQETIRPSITITGPEAPATPAGVSGGAPLQLEVFLNDRPLNLVSAFTLLQDGQVASTYSELDEIGLRIPQDMRPLAVIPLRRLAGVGYEYDEPQQAIRIRAAAAALKPTIIDAHVTDPSPKPHRPPFGAILNYAAYASASEAGSGFAFDGLSAEIEGRVFGRFGLLESSALVKLGTGESSGFTRLNTAYVHEDVGSLRTLQVGDFISGGFAWTRSIRMGGIQLRRNFALRPDLITVPLPTLTGSAAAPSTIDLFVNSVRSFTADVPTGPFQLTHPPLLSGAGVASLVLRDALGREVVSSTPFYASPELLAPGLSDFSAEIGFPRRDFGVRSADYAGKLSVSVSWRRGLSERLTTSAHGEATKGLALIGAGATFTLGTLGAVSIAASGSRTRLGAGALVNLAFESRVAGFAVLARTQRVYGPFEDLASWTETLPPHVNRENYLLGRPRELDQLTLSTPAPWRGGGFGASYIRTGGAGAERSRIVNLSYNQEIGRFSLFASGFLDLDRADAGGVFLGLSVPFGHGVSGSTGLSHRGRSTSGFVEASRHGNHEPGEFGWTLRAAAGERQEGEAIVRYSTGFARTEAGLRYLDGQASAHGFVEGALALVGGGLHASQRLDDSFAVVEVGSPGVAVFHENRPAGRTNARGQAIVPHLRPYVGNRIAVDPASLPIDAEVVAEANVAPYARVPVRVDMRIDQPGGAALIGFVDEAGAPLPIGSEARVSERNESFVIGYDGVAYLRGLGATNRVEVTLPDGATCSARFAFTPSENHQVQHNGVVCRPS